MAFSIVTPNDLVEDQAQEAEASMPRLTFPSRFCSTRERNWRIAAANGAVYSPLPGPTSLTFGGGTGAFARLHGVDTTPLSPDIDPSTIVELKDDQGRTWYARNMLGGWWSAFRDLSDQEVIDEVRRGVDRTQRMMPARSVQAIYKLAMEIFWTASTMSPDRLVSRSKRREMKRRLVALADFQMALVTGEVSGSLAIDQRMVELGALWRPLDPVRELDLELA